MKEWSNSCHSCLCFRGELFIFLPEFPWSKKHNAYKMQNELQKILSHSSRRFLSAEDDVLTQLRYRFVAAAREVRLCFVGIVREVRHCIVVAARKVRCCFAVTARYV